MGTRGAPGAALRRAAGAKKKSSEALFSELLGSTVFIRPGAAGTRGALEVVLRREAGAGAHGTRAGPGAALSQEVGTGATVTRGAPGAALSREVGTGVAVTRGTPGAALSREVGTGATVTHDAPELPCAGRRVLPPELPRAGLLLAASGDFFLVASYCPTKHSRVLKKNSSTFSSPPLLLCSRRCHGFFFDFFRPCPSVAMSGAF
jgi:hypothetical protein